MEQAVTGRIFQALPTQTDTIVALIYKIDAPKRSKPKETFSHYVMAMAYI
jgi:hypothetical protein